jgi:hypothetical protein
VTQEAHRFGGTEFQVEGLEFMHHHGPSFLDIRLSKNDQATTLKNGTALPHRFAPQAGWVSFRLEKAEDLDPAKKLIQLAYENARTSMEAHRMRGQSKLWLTSSSKARSKSLRFWRGIPYHLVNVFSEKLITP